jgi:electron transport complex protein RnfC
VIRLSYGFRGGVHPDDKKKSTRHKPIELLPPPPLVVLPLSMHIGAPCEPTVKPGQEVRMGQLIADSPSPVSAPIHATVSGIVAAVEPRPHPSGPSLPAIVIENDGKDTPDPSMIPKGSVESLTPDELLHVIHSAGIVGLGGAAFPTHTKIRSGMGKIKTLIVNGCECEPYITSDHRLMREAPEEIIGGLKVLMKILGQTSAVIAVESNKRDAVDSLRHTLPKRSSIKVVTLHTRYPQGAEKQLIRAVTGREVPPGQLPASVGAAVFNVDTAAAIHRAVTMGIPLMRRIVTVSGSAVSNAKNLSVRIGTMMREVFAATGGFREQPSKVIMGGPMMGIAQHDLNAPVVKGCSSLLAFSADELTPPEQSCIRCGHCVEVCPMRLLPVYMHQYERKDMLAELEKQRVTDCIECGCCSYACPARLHLVHSFRTGKQKLADAKRKG